MILSLGGGRSSEGESIDGRQSIDGGRDMVLDYVFRISLCVGE